ncbi:hypothetical protein ASJ79_14190 [Mycobacterium sp. NAZ190054]|nr:hypothetical protein ASJ79_14190 [Mycobacterium sp. NAZ190054]
MGCGGERFEHHVDTGRPQQVGIAAGMGGQRDRSGEPVLAKPVQESEIRLQFGDRADDVLRPVERQRMPSPRAIRYPNAEVNTICHPPE